MVKFDASKLLDKEMDRKDFLKAVAFGLVAMSGVAAALKASGALQIGSFAATEKNTPLAQSQHYSASTYGGR